MPHDLGSLNQEVHVDYVTILQHKLRYLFPPDKLASIKHTFLTHFKHPESYSNQNHVIFDMRTNRLMERNKEPTDTLSDPWKLDL